MVKITKLIQENKDRFVGKDTIVICEAILSKDLKVFDAYSLAYLEFPDVKYEGNWVTRETKLDINLLKLKETNVDNVKSLYIPKGSKVNILLNTSDYDYSYESIDPMVISYNGIEVYLSNNAESDAYIDNVYII